MPLIDPETPDDGFTFLDEISAQFLRVIKQHYTRDAAVEAVDALEPILGKAWKGRLIFGIMSNKYQTVRNIRIKLRLDPHSEVVKKINVIKEVRSVSGMGLVDAKKAVEDAYIVAVDIPIEACPENRDPKEWDRRIQNSIQEIRNCGFHVEVA